MSILAAAPAPHEWIPEAAVAAACLGVSVPLLARMVRRGPLDRPERLPPGSSAWPLVFALSWGLLVWMMVPVAYVAWRGPALRAATQPATQSAPATARAQEVDKPRSPPDGTLDLATLPPRDVAFLSAVPHLAALLALIAFDLTIYGGDLSVLGFSLRQARTGLATGAGLSLLIVPFVFGAAVVTDWFYRWIEFEHPREHDLLRVLGQSAEPWVRVALAAGAVVVAPLSEEMLFRGHAQTILRRALARLGPAAAAPQGGRGFPLDAPHASEDTEVVFVPATPPAWATWGAVVLASMLFASVHDRWTWPPIFFLSLGLGWVYERTGNLWAPVAVHAAFNAISTLIFLSTTG